MEPLPRRIVSRGSGASFVVFASPLSGEGSPLTFGCALPPQNRCELSSVDPSMALTFVVGRGVLELHLTDNTCVTVTSGEQFSLSPGTVRSYRNPGDQVVCFVTTAVPGTLLERCLRERCGVPVARHPTAPVSLFAHQLFGHGRTVPSPLGAS